MSTTTNVFFLHAQPGEGIPREGNLRVETLRTQFEAAGLTVIEEPDLSDMNYDEAAEALKAQLRKAARTVVDMSERSDHVGRVLPLAREVGRDIMLMCSAASGRAQQVHELADNFEHPLQRLVYTSPTTAAANVAVFAHGDLIPGN